MIYLLESYYGNDPIRSEQITQAHYEFLSEEVDRFCATSKDIMDDVVVRVSPFLCFLHVTNNLNGIPYDRGMILWEIKIRCCKVMHNWIDLNRRGMDTMSDKCSWRCTDAYTSKTRGQSVRL